jgi:hypothetical protein
MFRFTIRELVLVTVIAALGVALCLQSWRARVAWTEARNRTLENDYLTSKVLALEAKLYGTLDNPTSMLPPTTPRPDLNIPFDKDSFSSKHPAGS